MGLIIAAGACRPSPPAAPDPPPVVDDAEPEDPLLLAGRVGLELINAKGQQIRARAGVYEGDVFRARLAPTDGSADCAPVGEGASVLRASPGEELALTIENRRDEPFVPHIIEYRDDGLRIRDLEAPLAPGAATTTCVWAGHRPGDVLVRVVGTSGPAELGASVMYETARDIASSDPGNTEARALATLLDNENRQRLLLARLLHAQGQPLPPEMVLGRVRTEPDADQAEDVLAIPPDAGLLVYAEIDGRMSVAWYERGHDAFAVPLEVAPGEIGPLVDGLVAGLAGDGAADRAPVPRGLDRVRSSAVAVSPADVADALLPAPVRRRLSAVDSLVVVPARSLGRLPWLALSIDGEPLVASHAVTVAPDLVALADDPPVWSRDFRAPLVVGDPTLTAEAFPDWDFPELPGAASEARAVAAALGTEALTGPEATRDRVLARVQGADLLYLATHGVADRDAPLWDSFVALSGGPWSAVDVLTADLDRARLTVLSACQTGLGQDVDAGTIGLARSFYKAGVPRVVMSLWNVDDAGTRALMLGFFDELSRVPPSEALRRSADRLRRDGAPPSVWASFSVMGHPG